MRSAVEERNVSEKSELAAAIKNSLQTYACQHTLIEGENDGLPLLDKLCPPGALDVSEGLDERDLLADHLWRDLEHMVGTPEPPAPKHEHEWTDRHGYKWRVRHTPYPGISVIERWLGEWTLDEEVRSAVVEELSRLAGLVPPGGE